MKALVQYVHIVLIRKASEKQARTLLVERR